MNTSPTNRPVPIPVIGSDGRSNYGLSPTHDTDPNMGTVVGRGGPSRAQRFSMFDSAGWLTRGWSGQQASLASAKTPRVRQDRLLPRGV